MFLMNDESAFMCGCKKWLTYDDMFSVGESLADTIGLRGQSGLCTWVIRSTVVSWVGFLVIKS